MLIDCVILQRLAHAKLYMYAMCSSQKVLLSLTSDSLNFCLRYSYCTPVQEISTAASRGSVGDN